MSSGPASLDLSQPLVLQRSIKRGWKSFNRTAGRFVIFMLIMEAINEPAVVLTGIASTPIEQSKWPAAAVWICLALSWSLTLVIHWWMTLGLFRGAWLVLTGRQPRLADLLRWDGPGLRRWIAMWFVILGALALIAVSTLMISLAVSLVVPVLMPAPLLLGGLLTLLLLLSQLFCLPLVVVEELPPLQAFRLGLRGLVHHPGSWLLLGLIQVVPQLLILLSPVQDVGLVLGIRLVTMPLAMCILIAAYLDRLEAPISRETRA